MHTARQDVEPLLRNLPDDRSHEDIQYHLYVLEKIKRGEQRASTEEKLAQEQGEARLKKWITE